MNYKQAQAFKLFMHTRKNMGVPARIALKEWQLRMDGRSPRIVEELIKEPNEE